MISTEQMWDRLIGMGTSEETLQIVSAINGYNRDTMESVLYAAYGMRSFTQVGLSDFDDDDE